MFRGRVVTAVRYVVAINNNEDGLKSKAAQSVFENREN